jgi:hypothetical protein
MSSPVRTTPAAPSETARAKQTMPDETKLAIEERKQLHLVAAKISEMNWGKGLSPHMQNAVAAYCRESMLDASEINVLGGNIYRNANYYLRRLSEMLDDDEVEYAKPDHVHADARLAAVAKGEGEQAAWARAELDRRTRERIALNIPDAAVAAVVFRVKLRGVDLEFTGAKWCGGGTRKSDPVGDSFPVETAETRACRRCMRYVASQIPRLKWREDELDERAAQITARLVDERDAARIQGNRIPVRSGFDNGHIRPMPIEGDDPYAPNARMKELMPAGAVVEGHLVERVEPVRTVESPDVMGEPGTPPRAAEPSVEEFQNDLDLVDETERPAPGSKNVRMPKGGNIADALPLDDLRGKPNRNAQLD